MTKKYAAKTERLRGLIACHTGVRMRATQSGITNSAMGLSGRLPFPAYADRASDQMTGVPESDQTLTQKQLIAHRCEPHLIAK